MFLQMDFFSNLITQVRDLSRCNFVFLQFYIFAILNESRFQEWEKDPSREIEYWHWRSNGCKIGTFCVGVDTKKSDDDGDVDDDEDEDEDEDGDDDDDDDALMTLEKWRLQGS